MAVRAKADAGKKDVCVVVHVTATAGGVIELSSGDLYSGFRAIGKTSSGNLGLNIFPDRPFHGSIEGGLEFDST
jgi:hypothetical protein